MQGFEIKKNYWYIINTKARRIEAEARKRENIEQLCDTIEQTEKRLYNTVTRYIICKGAQVQLWIY